MSSPKCTFTPILVKDVSIILSTLNREKTLERCINSVIDQSFKNWDLIIVDDGSTDKSQTIIKKYTKLLDNIYCIKQPNKGQSIARNNAAKIAKSNYLTFIDSDDHYLSNHIEYRIQQATCNPNIDLFYGGFEIIGDPYVVCKYNHNKKIHLHSTTITGTLFVKRSLFYQLNGFKHINYGEDSDFVERAKRVARTKKLFKRTYIYDRTTIGSITNQKLKSVENISNPSKYDLSVSAINKR